MKTVKFHARTGMIESNRVSAKLRFSGGPGPMAGGGRMNPSSLSRRWGSWSNPKAKSSVTCHRPVSAQHGYPMAVQRVGKGAQDAVEVLEKDPCSEW